MRIEQMLKYCTTKGVITMTNAEIVTEMERICRKIGRTKDPIDLWMLDAELERLNELIERGGK